MNPMDRVLNALPAGFFPRIVIAACVAGLAGCVPGGSSGGGSSSQVVAQCPVVGNDGNCTGSCIDSLAGDAGRLTADDVRQIIGRALREAQSLRTTAAAAQNATVAVVDRVGNVLGVARPADAASTTFTINPEPLTLAGPLAAVPALDTGLGAIAKAITAAYLSSEGNAFTTRTANYIVQELFPPGVNDLLSGPLYGVQFSQLPCSDLVNSGDALGAGPRRSPLGLAADPGGLPLYKNGTPVGGIGVIADGLYGIDREVNDTSQNDRNDTTLNNLRNIDERIALAGTFGYEPPATRLASLINVDIGGQFPFADATAGDLTTAAAPDPGALTATLVTVTGYFDGAALRAGTRFTDGASGYIAADDNFTAGSAAGRNLDAFVLTTDGTTNRFPPIDGTDGRLVASEVRTLLQNALMIANREQAQIRLPTCSQSRVTISVVDTNGEILGIARTRDAPVFGTDVSLQKARSAMFFSSPGAAAALTAAGLPTDYVTAYRNITTPVGVANGLADGFAFGNRSIGNLGRPYFPDAQATQGRFRGPFSVAIAQWSPFNVGLQSDLVTQFNGGPPLGGLAATGACTLSGGAETRLRNGLQIFPGGVPIFKNGQLAGGIGVSGDGIDQDDLVSFLGLHNAGVALGGVIGNAPNNLRVSNRDHVVLATDGVTQVGTFRPRYVQCPSQPFIGSTEQNVCDGK